MRILITGSNGQVGYCLTEQLKEHPNVTVLALDVQGLDITNEQAVKVVVDDFKPTVIINAAAHTAVDRAEEEVELSHAINCDGPKYLAMAAEAVGASILHISTDYVFEGNKLGNYLETDLPNPQGVYGQSKLAGEQAIAEICSSYIILRTAWVFGEHGNNFVKTMLKLGQNRKELGIIGDQFGGPTYAGDIARALITIAYAIDSGTKVSSGVYHFSGFPHVSWYEFAKAIFSAAEAYDCLENVPVVNEITAAQYPLPAPRPSNSKLDCSKIEQAFSIPQSDWLQALTRIQEY